MEKNIKIALSILLLLCLFRMPYGFYELVRYLSFAGFLILAYLEKEKKEMPLFFIFCWLYYFSHFLRFRLGALCGIQSMCLSPLAYILALRKNNFN
ncbi:DUF6804 family protein [Ornithobacterium rhinotracheale]